MLSNNVDGDVLSFLGKLDRLVFLVVDELLIVQLFQHVTYCGR